MSEAATKVLLVDPDIRARTLVANQLSTTGCEILQASDGVTAMNIVMSQDVKLVVTELYLPTGSCDCLIKAIREDRKLRKTRTMALTHRCLAADREWAMQAGADAYLIKPTRAERMRYVVSRLATTKGANASVSVVNEAVMERRDTLDQSLTEIERGSLTGVTSIVFSRAWWEKLPKQFKSWYRGRAKAARVSLRSDSRMSAHFVEVRGPSRNDVGLSSERPESPYRR